MPMLFKDDGATLLFLKYALPCAPALLARRGLVAGQDIAAEMAAVSSGCVPKNGFEYKFVVATAMCSIEAKRLGLQNIDADAVREYFLYRHNGLVLANHLNGEEPKEFDYLACMSRPGEVLAVHGSSALVETNLGAKSYNSLFLKDAKNGDLVAVHLGYITERITKKMAERMLPTLVENACKRSKGVG